MLDLERTTSIAGGRRPARSGMMIGARGLMFVQLPARARTRGADIVQKKPSGG